MTYYLQVLFDKPAAYWRQTEATGPFSDLSGYGHTGTVTGTPTYRQRGLFAGNLYSVRYGAATMASTMTAGVMLPDRQKRGWSLEVWVQRTSATLATVLGRSGSGIRVDANGIYFTVGTTTITHPVGDWTLPKHIVATWVEGQMQLFVNGVMVGAADEAVIPAGLGNITVGSDNFIAEPAVYNYALHPDRIWQHYRAGTWIPAYWDVILEDEPLDYWRFTDGWTDATIEVDERTVEDWRGGSLYNMYVTEDSDLLFQDTESYVSLTGTATYVAGVRGNAISISTGNVLAIDIRGAEATLDESGTIGFYFNVGANQTGVQPARTLLEFGNFVVERTAAGVWQASDVPVEDITAGTTPAATTVALGTPAAGWRHMVITWDEGGTEFYIDGVFVAVAEFTPTVNDNTEPLTLGSRNDGTLPYGGAFDEFQAMPDQLTTTGAASMYSTNPDGTTNYLLKFDSSLAKSSMSLRYSPSFFLDASETIGGSKIAWAASSGTIVETSINEGSTWQTPTNGGPIPGVIAGMDPASIVVQIRQRMNPGASQEFVEWLEAEVYANPYQVESISEGGMASLYNATILENGVYVPKPGYVTVPSAGTTVVEFWVIRHTDNAVLEYIFDARPALANAYVRKSAAGAVETGAGVIRAYVNGTLKTLAIGDFPLGQWVHVVLVLSAAHTGTLYFLAENTTSNTMNATLSDVSLWDYEDTAIISYHAQAGIFGRDVQTTTDNVDTLSVTENDLTEYPQTWQIIST
jgi:hypothetical protein